MDDNSKYVFGTCVSKRAQFEYKPEDKVFSPIGFAEVVNCGDNSITVAASAPNRYEMETYDESQIEHVSVEEWPYFGENK